MRTGCLGYIADRRLTMDCRSLGRTGLQVSELGYGAWGIGKSMWLGAEDDESLRALHRRSIMVSTS